MQRTIQIISPRKYANLVNELVDTAIIYGNTQQLRAQMSKTLSRFIQPEPPVKDPKE